jgi:hypothetical protein
MPNHQPLIAAAVLVGVLATGCSPSDEAQPTEETSTTSTTSTTTTAAPTTSLSVPDKYRELRAEYGRRTRTLPEVQPVLLVHPECANHFGGWTEDTFFEGVRDPLLPDPDWQHLKTVEGTFERTDTLAEFDIETGIFTAFDGTQIEVNTGAQISAGSLWASVQQEINDWEATPRNDSQLPNAHGTVALTDRDPTASVFG